MPPAWRVTDTTSPLIACWAVGLRVPGHTRKANWAYGSELSSGPRLGVALGLAAALGWVGWEDGEAGGAELAWDDGSVAVAGGGTEVRAGAAVRAGAEPPSPPTLGATSPVPRCDQPTMARASPTSPASNRTPKPRGPTRPVIVTLPPRAPWAPRASPAPGAPRDGSPPAPSSGRRPTP